LLRNLLTARLARVPAGGWEANTVGNHDRSRSFSFYADGQHDRERAQMALAMVAYLQGTPVFYYGEEIGMRDFLPASVDAFKDGLGVWFYEALQRYGTEPEEAFEAAAKFMCRDRCRRPMLWENAPHGGFSPAEVTPWLTSNDDYAQGINVAEQEADPASMLNFFREMVQVRQNTPALQTGAQEILPDTGDILAFWRTTDSQRCLVALNMAAEANTLTLDESLTRLYSNAAQPSEPESARLSLQAYEVWVGESTV
jgi:glycosidase